VQKWGKVSLAYYVNVKVCVFVFSGIIHLHRMQNQNATSMQTQALEKNFQEQKQRLEYELKQRVRYNGKKLFNFPYKSLFYTEISIIINKGEKL